MNRQTPAEDMFGILEEVVQIEKTFEAQQEPLVELEKKEKEIYQSIIELNMQEYDEVVRLADEAITITEKRKEHIDKERESMQESSAAFEAVPDIINEIDELELKEQATELYNLMQNRYKIHEELYNAYSDGLVNDIELYNLFKDEELTIDQLGEQIKIVNAAYEKVIDSNNKFNEVTEQYNQKKLMFYEAAGLEIQN
ncbi:YkyA family protein [Mesobacillus maritimus]|uniref:YkyA family protein n=1 Tax=Mesobacillus maritimus TaxID=1643336 RepID=UPI003850772D